MDVSGERRSWAMSTNSRSPSGPASREVKYCFQSGSIASRTRSMATRIGGMCESVLSCSDQPRTTSARSSSRRRRPRLERVRSSTGAAGLTC